MVGRFTYVQNVQPINMPSLNSNKHGMPAATKSGLVGDLTLIHTAKGPKGLSCFEMQTAKHFLK